MSDLSREDAIKANIYVHSFLANSGEYNKSPHFLPENIEKVKGILNRLVPECSQKEKAVDFGCGTGFMIHMTRHLFHEVHGVDVTTDMMKQVDLTSGNVFLHENLAEDTPFDSGSFDFATAYSFMDHLLDYRSFLKEAYRVLKEGGILYSDLNPNRDFIMAIAALERRRDDAIQVQPIVAREIQGAIHNGDYYQQKFGMDAGLLEKAEPVKTFQKGFNAEEVLAEAKKIGFKNCRVEFEWFLGQAKVMHEQSKLDSETVERYLNSALPVTAHLFKYLRFIFVK